MDFEPRGDHHQKQTRGAIPSQSKTNCPLAQVNMQVITSVRLERETTPAPATMVSEGKPESCM